VLIKTNHVITDFTSNFREKESLEFDGVIMY